MTVQAASWPAIFEVYEAAHATSAGSFAHYAAVNFPILDILRRYVTPPAGILEVGTGHGHLACLLASQGYDVTAVEIDERMLKRARELAEVLCLPVRFRLGDGFALLDAINQSTSPPLRGATEGYFDVAISSGTIEHFPSARQAGWLREQGRFAKVVMAVAPTVYALENDAQWRPSGATPMTVRQLRYVARMADLEVLSSGGYGNPGRAGHPGLTAFRSLAPAALPWWLTRRGHLSATVWVVAQP